MIMHDEKNRNVASAGAPPADEPSDLEVLAHHFLAAVEAKDPKAVAEAFHAMAMCCDQPDSGG